MFTAHELPRNHVYMIKSTIQLVKYTSKIISYSKKHFFHALAAIFQNLTTISEQNMVNCLSPGSPFFTTKYFCIHFAPTTDISRLYNLREHISHIISCYPGRSFPQIVLTDPITPLESRLCFIRHEIEDEIHILLCVVNYLEPSVSISLVELETNSQYFLH